MYCFRESIVILKDVGVGCKETKGGDFDLANHERKTEKLQAGNKIKQVGSTPRSNSASEDPFNLSQTPLPKTIFALGLRKTILVQI